MTSGELRGAMLEAARGAAGTARRGAVSETPAAALASCVVLERQAGVAWPLRR